MNNLFGTLYPNQSPLNMRNNSFARAGEPISVNGIESVNSFQTMPNTITVLFHEKEPIFYRITTDTNNHPVVQRYRYEEIEPETNKGQYVTIEDLNKMKEDIINEWKHISNSTAGATSTPTDATNEANIRYTGSESESSTNASSTGGAKSSIW